MVAGKRTEKIGTYDCFLYLFHDVAVMDFPSDNTDTEFSL